MAVITLNTNNIATTGRPNEFKGTIAIDHVTPGQSIGQIIRPLISAYEADGYSFCGINLYVANLHNLSDLNNHPIDIILSKRKGEKEFEYKKVSKTVSLSSLLIATTALEIRFFDAPDFEHDRIDWKNVEEIEEEEEE